MLIPQPSTFNHWSFNPPRRSTLPKNKNAQWVRTPIDAFIAAEHEARGLKPSPEASPRVLIRRLSLDLLGLPPTPEAIDDFLADPSPDAYEKLVARLLASPHYGERWGRHWLDLARWAETDGYEANDLRVSAWRYRDYVVRSFNLDKPYDEFLREQIAGDELVPYSDEHLIATGFLAAGRLNCNEEDKALQRNESLVDVVNATASVTLGLSLNCAQCHDHKFDPLTARDYYRFHGFFVKGQVNTLLLKDPALWTEWENLPRPPEFETARKLRQQLYDPVHARLQAEARQKLKLELLAALITPATEQTSEQIELAKKAAQEIEITKDQVKKALSDDDQKLLAELDKKISKIDKELNEKKPQAWGFYSPVTSPHKFENLPPRGMYPMPYEPEKLKAAKPVLLKRGDVHRVGVELEPGFPAVLLAADARRLSSEKSEIRNPKSEIEVSLPTSAATTYSRSALVDWLVSPSNPLTARVWVNFIWQQHFGRGLVATADDFGTKGAQPTHPELLDWLACELMQPTFSQPSTINPSSARWSTKHLHRLIVLSSAYRQASQPDPTNEAIDSDNKFIWRWSPRRLEAEAIRDATLLVSGALDRTVGGPSRPKEIEDQCLRRALYLRQKRHELPTMSALFDSPLANESCPRRHVSTVSLQPLYLMNSEFLLKRAAAFAAAVHAKAGNDPEGQINEAFVTALGRPPEIADREAARALLATYATRAPANTSEAARGSNENSSAPPPALVHFCHALLNVNEFVYLE